MPLGFKSLSGILNHDDPRLPSSSLGRSLRKSWRKSLIGCIFRPCFQDDLSKSAPTPKPLFSWCHVKLCERDEKLCAVLEGLDV